MATIEREKLLQVKEVIDEINRYKWLQSELAGFDVGFQKAADDWFQKYAAAWVAYHLPKAAKETKGKKK